MANSTRTSQELLASSIHFHFVDAGPRRLTTYINYPLLSAFENSLVLILRQHSDDTDLEGGALLRMLLFLLRYFLNNSEYVLSDSIPLWGEELD